MKKCIYCKCDLDDRNIIDFCKRCGVGAFGEKMFAAIIQNMKEASGRGDLDQGRFWIIGHFVGQKALKTCYSRKK